MLNVTALKSAKDADKYFNLDYYTPDELASISCWRGKGAKLLGLEGPVQPKDLLALLEGKLPSCEQLGRVQNGKKVHRPGYDLTFSAPKSVSLMMLQDKRLEQAYKDAIDTSLEALETKIAQTRRGRAKVFEKTDNICIAKIEHYTSRALDPARHTHCVLINATLTKDNNWRSISSELAYKYKMAGGAIFRAELAKNIKGLGYNLNVDATTGFFEIEGISREQIEHFSRRHLEIKKVMQEQGWSTYRASEIASLMTRNDKDDSMLDIVKLYTDWQQRLADQGVNLEQIEQKALNTGSIILNNPDNQAANAVHFATKHLTSLEAVITDSDILEVALDHAMGEATYADIEQAVNNNKDLIKIKEGLYTTTEMVALEKNNIFLLQQGLNTSTPIANLDFAKIGQQYDLTVGQLEAVKLILTSSDKIVGVQGYAGTGKSRAINTMRHIISTTNLLLRDKVEVMALAPTGKAAIELRQLGLNSNTIHNFLTKLEHNIINFDPAKRHLIFCDEMSMLDSKLMNKLLHATNVAGIDIKLAMIGDEEQLEAIGSGKPWAQFKNHGMKTVNLTEIKRQVTKPALEAVEAVINHDIKLAFQKIGATNITEEQDREVRLNNIAQQYLNLSDDQMSRTLVLTQTNLDRLELNNLIRQGLIAAGKVQSTSSRFEILTPKHLSHIQKQNASYYQSQDTVRFNQNYKRLAVKRGDYCEVLEVKGSTIWLATPSGITSFQPQKIAGSTEGAIEVYNKSSRELSVGDSINFTRRNSINKTEIVTGTLGKVTAIDPDNITVKLPDTHIIRLATKSLKDQHFDYSYAVTTHAAQGSTYDYAIVNLDSMNSSLTTDNLFYVVISRVRYQCHLHVDEVDAVSNAIAKNTGAKLSALEELERARIEIITPTIETYSPYDLDYRTTKANYKHWDIAAIESKIANQLPEIYASILGKPINQKLSNDRTFRIGTKGGFVINKNGLWFDHETGQGGNIYQFLQNYNNQSFKEALDYLGNLSGLERNVDIDFTEKKIILPSHPTTLAIGPDDLKAMARAKTIWDKGVSIADTIAEKYLQKHRNIKLEHDSKMLRFVSNMRDAVDGKQLPALLVAITKGSKFHGVQAIFLEPTTAKKANITSPKQIYGRVKFGGNAKFAGDGSSNIILAAEGLETALSLKQVCPQLDVIATLGKGNFNKLDFNEKRNILYCLDNDNNPEKTLSSFAKIKALIETKGHKVDYIIPSEISTDFNDILQDRGATYLQELLHSKLTSMTTTLDLNTTKTKNKAPPQYDQQLASIFKMVAIENNFSY